MLQGRIDGQRAVVIHAAEVRAAAEVIHRRTAFRFILLDFTTSKPNLWSS